MPDSHAALISRQCRAVSWCLLFNPLPCFSETAGRQVELYALYKENESTEKMAYSAPLTDHHRVKRILSLQCCVSSPSRAKQRIKPDVVRFACNPSSWQVGTGKVSSLRPAHYITRSRWAWAVWDQLRKKKKKERLDNSSNSHINIHLSVTLFQPQISRERETTMIMPCTLVLCYKLCCSHVECVKNKGSLSDKYPVVTLFKRPSDS